MGANYLRHHAIIEELANSPAVKEQEYRPLHIDKLKRIFETAEKGLERYMHPLMKRNKFFTVRELEMFIELGHSPKDFLNLLEEHKSMKVPEDIQ